MSFHSSRTIRIFAHTNSIILLLFSSALPLPFLSQGASFARRMVHGQQAEQH